MKLFKKEVIIILFFFNFNIKDLLKEKEIN